MQIREHRGFNIEVHDTGKGYVSEIYRKGKLLHTIRNEKVQDDPFRNSALVIEAARDWIDRIYPPRKIKYFGEV
jgi:hypothetical protein